MCFVSFNLHRRVLSNPCIIMLPIEPSGSCNTCPRNCLAAVIARLTKTTVPRRLSGLR